MIRRPPRSTLSSSSAASDVYKRQTLKHLGVRTFITTAGLTSTTPLDSVKIFQSLMDRHPIHCWRWIQTVANGQFFACRTRWRFTRVVLTVVSTIPILVGRVVDCGLITVQITSGTLKVGREPRARWSTSKCGRIRWQNSGRSNRSVVFVVKGTGAMTASVPFVFMIW